MGCNLRNRGTSEGFELGWPKRHQLGGCHCWSLCSWKFWREMFNFGWGIPNNVCSQTWKKVNVMIFPRKQSIRIIQVFKQIHGNLRVYPATPEMPPFSSQEIRPYDQGLLTTKGWHWWRKVVVSWIQWIPILEFLLVVGCIVWFCFLGK